MINVKPNDEARLNISDSVLIDDVRNKFFRFPLYLGIPVFFNYSPNNEISEKLNQL